MSVENVGNISVFLLAVENLEGISVIVLKRHESNKRFFKRF